jgi:flagellar biosynthesis/type III secretory pathway protein FliH
MQMEPRAGTPPATMNIAVEVFTYPAVELPDSPVWEAFPSVAADERGQADDQTTWAAPHLEIPADEIHARELQCSFDAGMERGREEGRLAERQASAMSAKDQERRFPEEVVRLADSFAAERARYFEKVECEVVRLALAIATRILRRESQVDPLLLSGAVRVALGQLSASTQVRLRVPPSELELWKDTMTHLPNLPVKPEVVPGEGMRVGECVLDAELGSVDLGIQSQLAQIERGFFDRTMEEGLRVEEDMAE